MSSSASGVEVSASSWQPIVTPIASLEKYPAELFFALDEQYVCGVCMEVPFEPPNLPCGHLFCRSCLVKWCNQGKSTCPTCRDPFTIGDISTVTALARRHIAGMKVRCRLRELGCNAEITIGANRRGLEEHESQQCSFAEIECQDCKKKLLKRQRQVHNASECEQRLVKCPSCNESLRVCELSHHRIQSDDFYVLGSVRVPCPPCHAFIRCSYACNDGEHHGHFLPSEIRQHILTCGDVLITCDGKHCQEMKPHEIARKDYKHHLIQGDDLLMVHLRYANLSQFDAEAAKREQRQIAADAINLSDVNADMVCVLAEDEAIDITRSYLDPDRYVAEMRGMTSRTTGPALQAERITPTATAAAAASSSFVLPPSGSNDEDQDKLQHITLRRTDSDNEAKYEDEEKAMAENARDRRLMGLTPHHRDSVLLQKEKGRAASASQKRSRPAHEAHLEKIHRANEVEARRQQEQRWEQEEYEAIRDDILARFSSGLLATHREVEEVKENEFTGNKRNQSRVIPREEFSLPHEWSMTQEERAREKVARAKEYDIVRYKNVNELSEFKKLNMIWHAKKRELDAKENRRVQKFLKAEKKALEKETGGKNKKIASAAAAALNSSSAESPSVAAAAAAASSSFSSISSPSNTNRKRPLEQEDQNESKEESQSKRTRLEVENVAALASHSDEEDEQTQPAAVNEYDDEEEEEEKKNDDDEMKDEDVDEQLSEKVSRILPRELIDKAKVIENSVDQVTATVKDEAVAVSSSAPSSSTGLSLSSPAAVPSSPFSYLPSSIVPPTTAVAAATGSAANSSKKRTANEMGADTTKIKLEDDSKEDNFTVSSSELDANKKVKLEYSTPTPTIPTASPPVDAPHPILTDTTIMKHEVSA